MIVRVERVVPFPRDAVYAWWTDFREDDHPGSASPATSTREIVRREGREIWIRDRARRPAPVTILEHVTLDPPGGYRVEAHYPAVDVRYEYRFDAVAGGTAVRLTADLIPHHIGRLLSRLFGRRIRRYAERDTDFHLRRMAVDLADRRG